MYITYILTRYISYSMNLKIYFLFINMTEGLYIKNYICYIIKLFKNIKGK